MRKLKLLMATLALIVGGNLVWAETDVTSLLTNPDFTSGTTGWTGFGSDKGQAFVIVDNKTFQGSNDKNAEMWKAKDQTLGTGEISQVVSNLPEGVYRLTVNMRSDVKCYLFAEVNSLRQKNYSVKAAADVSQQELIFIVRNESNVTIGFGTDGTSLNNYNWIAVDDFKLYRVSDDVGETELTSQIANWDFTDCTSNSFPGWTITAQNGNKQNYGESCVEYWIGTASEGNFDYYQTVSGLPVGRYTLSASMWNTTNANGQGTSVNGECGVYGTSNNVTVFKGVGSDSNGANLATYTTDPITVSNGSLQLGVKNNATMGGQWFGVDWIKLTFLGNAISNYSPTAFTTGSSVTKDAWNRYQVSTAGVYKIESTEAVTITYAQDDSKDADSETATLSIAASGYTTIALTSGYFYFKSDKTSTITMTSLIPDGTYYLKASSTWNSTSKSVTAACGKYLARGNASGTHATIDKYGLPIAITTTADNKSTLSPQDTKRFYYHTENWQCWADKGSVGDDAKFDITLHDGEYRIHNTSMVAGKYFKYNNDDVNNDIISVYDDGTGANSGPIINWTLETPAEHATYLQGLKDAQAASVAQSASATSDYKSLTGITSMSDLSEKLHSEFFNQTPIVPSSDITSTGEKFQGNQPGGSNTGEIVYNGSVDITEPGIYKFSMQAFYRAASNEVTQPMHENGIDFPPVILFFGDSKTQIKSLYDETGHDAAVAGSDPADVLYNNKYYANSQASALKMFQDGKYFNHVYLYVASAGTYNYGVKYLGFANAISQWFCYTPQSVSITKYTEATSEEDRNELQRVFNTFTLGFEEGEYAPYNNVEAIEAWKKAKDVLESGTELKWKIHDAIIDLEGADWTQNLGEVNAFASGDFSFYEIRDGKDYPSGWNLYNGDNNHSRIMGGSEGTENTGLSASSSGKALLLKYNATYGETDGYTMPLKAGKIYKITFKHGRWNEAHPRVTNVVMTDPEGNPITLAPGFQAAEDGCQSDETKWYEYTGYFVSTTAGDYKFNLNKEGDNSQMQIGIADIDLRTAENITFADDGSVPTYAPGTYPTVKISRSLTEGRWATAVYPFAVRGVDNIAVLNSFDAGTGSIRFESAEQSVANKPFLMRSSSDKSVITLNNIDVSATTETPTVTKDEASLIGAYSRTEITDAKENYVLSNNMIYAVGAAVAYINPYRAYIQIEGVGGASRSLVFLVDDEETTAIEGLNSERATTVGNIYNLNGQLVRKNADNMNGLQKGIYIVGGKRITVK